ncbi:MAG: hypothetical protein ISR48_04835 [Alphaproteobacteria bacterium]|nr:hypothetical protein [Alphaproteobacteria bacterium]
MEERRNTNDRRLAQGRRNESERRGLAEEHVDIEKRTADDRRLSSSRRTEARRAD